jgi:hypothetical protein
MGPFRRSKRDVPSPPPSIDLKVEDSAYRRLGDALATVIVTLAEPPPDGARLLIRTDNSATTVDPMMVTREMPGTRSETHRMWFAVDLTAVMFGDGDFAIKTDEGEAPLPDPVAQPAWGAVEEEDPDIPAPVLAEANLRAAVAALEERVRDAESASAELKADSRRMGQAVAATLAEVQRERDQLLELIDGEADEARAPAESSASAATAAAPRPDAFLARLHAARGAASADD